MLLHLFEFISSCISSLFLSEIPFSNNQRVSTRSGEGQDIPPVVCAHIANQQNQAPPPPPPLNPTMDPATHQFLVTQMQLIQNPTDTIQNIQAQQNQPPLPAPPAPVDKHKEFMGHRPPTYSHSADPLDAND
jgi:hypothetical protein